MANILILTLVFPPDNVSTAQLMGDLAEDLVRAGHSVRVVTTTPHYNVDSYASAAQPLRGSLAGLYFRSVYRGIPVLHARMPAKGRNKVYRIATWAWFHLISTVIALAIRPRPDVIICPSPPLTIGVAAWLVGSVRHAPFIYNLQEIYPDVAINLGAVRNRVLIYSLRCLERFVYNRAFAISAISRRMRENVISKGVPASKVFLIPNFVDVDGFSPKSKSNGFSKAHALNGSFVVIYAGNMGRPQHLEILVEAADLLRDHATIKFVLMGNGSEWAQLRQRVIERKLKNVVFLGHHPYSTMPDAYAASDLCYVPQAPGTSTDGVPSKVYRILASGRPVLAYTDPDSDLAVLIREAKAGYIVSTSSAEALASAIEQAASDITRCAQLGSNGREHVLQHYDRRVVSAAYSKLVATVTAV